MSLGLVDKVLLGIILADFIGILLWIGFCLHLAYTKADLMLEHLKNSPAIAGWTPPSQGGPWSKLLLIGGISGLMTFPGFQVKRGQLSTEDLARFPTDLKRKLAILQWCMIGLLLVMLAFGVTIELGLI